MLNVGKIEEGFVLDHIKAGKSMSIYHHLQLDKLDCPVAIIKNARSNNFVIDRDKNGRYYYKLRNAQKTTICVGESYDTVGACSSAIESVKKFCGSKLVED